VTIRNNKGKMAVLAGGGYTSVEEYIQNIKEKELSKQIQKDLDELNSTGGNGNTSSFMLK
jgi:hypothetical protein